MKIRNGFVSNSSSSSFVLLLAKEAYEKIKDMDFVEELIDSGSIKNIKIANCELVQICGTSFDLSYDNNEELKEKLSKDEFSYSEWSE